MVTQSGVGARKVAGHSICKIDKVSMCADLRSGPLSQQKHLSNIAQNDKTDFRDAPDH